MPVGQKVSLVAEVQPAGTTSTNPQWTVPGTRVANYVVTCTGTPEPRRDYAVPESDERGGHAPDQPDGRGGGFLLGRRRRQPAGRLLRRRRRDEGHGLHHVQRQKARGPGHHQDGDGGRQYRLGRGADVALWY